MTCCARRADTDSHVERVAPGYRFAPECVSRAGRYRFGHRMCIARIQIRIRMCIARRSIHNRTPNVWRTKCVANQMCGEPNVWRTECVANGPAVRESRATGPSRNGAEKPRPPRSPSRPTPACAGCFRAPSCGRSYSGWPRPRPWTSSARGRSREAPAQ